MKSKEILSHILSEGLNKIGLDVGIVSNVFGDIYTVITCVTNDSSLKPGMQFELAQTYCADVIREKKTKYYQDVAEITTLLKHPCYLNTQLRSYVGTPLLLNGKTWGTLNYSSLYPHKNQYSKEEIELLESQAEYISTILSQQNA